MEEEYAGISKTSDAPAQTAAGVCTEFMHGGSGAAHAGGGRGDAAGDR